MMVDIKLNKLIVDGVELCASDDKKEFLTQAVLHLIRMEKEVNPEGTTFFNDKHVGLKQELQYKVENKGRSIPDPVTSSYIAYVMERT